MSTETSTGTTGPGPAGPGPTGVAGTYRSTESTVTSNDAGASTAGGEASQPLQPPQPVQLLQPVQPMAPAIALVQPEEHFRESEVSSTRWRVSPASVMAAASSVAFMLWGAVVLARAGIDTPLDEPVVEVAGFSATAILGLIVLGGGAMLLIAAFTRSRAAIAFISIVLGVAAAAVAIEPSWGQAALAAERDGAIAALVLLVITVAVALVAADIERVVQRRDERRS